MNKETIEAIATKVHWDLIPALESGSSYAILVEIVTAVLEAYEENHIRDVPKMVGKWQPIETALKDGTKYLGKDKDGNQAVIHYAKFDHVNMYGWQVVRYSEREIEDMPFKPTHYKLLT